jgi:hypothetical protein
LLPSRRRSAAWIGCVALFINAVNEMINIVGLYCVSVCQHRHRHSPEHCYTKTQLRNAENGVSHYALERVLSHSAPKTQCVHLTQSRDFQLGLGLYLESGAVSFVLIWFLCFTVRWLGDDAWDGLSLNSGI